MLYTEGGEVNYSKNPRIRTYSYVLSLIRFLLTMHNLAKCCIREVKWTTSSLITKCPFSEALLQTINLAITRKVCNLTQHMLANNQVATLCLTWLLCMEIAHASLTGYWFRVTVAPPEIGKKNLSIFIDISAPLMNLITGVSKRE